MMAAAKIYTGRKGRGHSICVYVKGNTQRAIDRIKEMNPDLADAGTTEVLDFLVQYYVDTKPEFEDGQKDSEGSGKRGSAGGIGRKKRLGLPS